MPSREYIYEGEREGGATDGEGRGREATSIVI